MAEDVQTQQETVCKCNNCPGLVEFDASRVGESVQCPHCGADTVLFIPKPKKQAKIISETIVVGEGREDGLEIAGGILLAIGVIGLTASLCVMATQKNGIGPLSPSVWLP